MLILLTFVPCFYTIDKGFKDFKIIKKLRYIAYILGGLLLLIVISLFLIRLPGVQTFLTQRIAAYLSGQLDTEVEVGAVDIAFFDGLVLEDFYIEDLHQDTVLYVERLTVSIGSIDQEARKLSFNTVMLERAKVELKYYEGEEEMNIDFLLDYFDSNDTTASEAWEISVGNLLIDNTSFVYYNYQTDSTDWGVDYDHLLVNNLNGAFRNIQLIGDTLTTNIEELSLNEKSGFVLEKMKADARIVPNAIDLKNLIVQTPQTELSSDFRFSFDSFSDFKTFNQSVKMNADFQNSLIHFKDIAYFAPDLRYLDEQIYLSGKVSGQVENLSGRNVEMHLFRNTYFVGDFDLRGLPNLEETFIYLKVKELETNARGITQIPLPPFDRPSYVTLPESFYELGNIYFKGNFTGFISDFVAYGDFTTKLGKLRTDLSLTEMENGLYSYDGQVQTQSFEAGPLFDVTDLENVSLDLKIKGIGLSKDEIDAELSGVISSLAYKAYEYKQIEVDGKISPNRFDGELSISDKNIDLSFLGSIDVNGRLPELKFEADLKESQLSKLNLFNVSDTSTSLSFKAEFDLIGRRLDDLRGKLMFEDIHYQDSLYNYLLSEITLEATGKDTNRLLRLRSDLLDGEVVGDYHLNQLSLALRDFATEYIPSASFKQKGPRMLSNHFNFDLRFKDLDPVTTLFIPTLEVDSGATFSGAFDLYHRKVNFQAFVPRMLTAGIITEGLSLEGNNKEDALKIDLHAKNCGFDDSTHLEDVHLELISANDSVSTYLDWKNETDRLYEADINLRAAFNGFDHIDFDFYDSYLIIGDSLWSFSQNNRIELDTTAIQFTEMQLGTDQRMLRLEGLISEDSTTTLFMRFDGLDLSYLNSFLPNKWLDVHGFAEGQASAKGIYAEPVINSDVQLEDLIVNGAELQKANLISNWNPQRKAVELNMGIEKDGQSMVGLSGAYFPYRKQESLDMQLHFNQFPISLLEHYIEEYLTGLSGSVSGTTLIKGTTAAPLLSGRLHLNNNRMHVNYLDTYYELDHELIIENDWIGFNLIEVKDEAGNKAIATGTIFHENFSKFNLDVGLELDNFLALNTTASDNSLYYGKAVVSGLTNIAGYADQLIFEVDVTTESGTRFNIPLDEDSEVSSSDFLTFTNSGASDQLEEEFKVDLDGIQLYFDLNVTPDAEIRLIFDEQIGDVMRARGDGNLKLEVNTLGNFNMYGQYAIQEGDYLFTLQNVINKKFLLEKGGTISWNGDPYDADIDLTAVYKLRASLYDILVDTTGNYRRRIPVELKLLMDGSLLNPDLTFDIGLPTADDDTREALQSILYVNQSEVNQQEMNQQVFGLLVLNRFLPPSGTGGVNENYQRAGVGATSSSEFLSNQLSNWLSQLSDDIDVGIRYQPGDELSSDEVEVALSTEIFDKRVVLDGNFGYSNNQYNLENQNNSGIIGEFTIEYKISKDGRFRVKGFNRSNNNSLLRTNSPYTQGLGLFYREEFDQFDELFRKYFRKSAQKSTADPS